MTIAAVLGVVKGAAGYWREIVMALLAVAVLWYRGQYHDCRADRAADKAAQAEAVLEAQRKADALSDKILAQQEEHRRELKVAVEDARKDIRNEPVTNACHGQPAIQRALRLHQQRFGGASASSP